MTKEPNKRDAARDTASVLAALPDVALVLDQMGRICFASAGSVEFLGARARDWVGQSALDRVHPEDCAAVAQRLKASRSGEQTPTTALPVRLSLDGDRWLPAMAHGFVEVEAQGLTGTLVFFRDVTGAFTRNSLQSSALHRVFESAEQLDQAELADKSWIASEVLPRLLGDGTPEDQVVGVIAMTVAPIVGSDQEAPEAPIADLAGRLRDVLRSDDVLARHGHNQLVVLCVGAFTARDASAIAHRLHTLCAPSALEASAPRSDYALVTGVAVASKGDDYREVLDFALSVQCEVARTGFLSAAG